MEASYHRHDISDNVWALLEPHLLGQRGVLGIANRGTLAGFASRLREMEQRSSAVHPLAQKRHMGKTSGNLDR